MHFLNVFALYFFKCSTHIHGQWFFSSHLYIFVGKNCLVNIIYFLCLRAEGPSLARNIQSSYSSGRISNPHAEIYTHSDVNSDDDTLSNHVMGSNSPATTFNCPRDSPDKDLSLIGSVRIYVFMHTYNDFSSHDYRIYGREHLLTQECYLNKKSTL